MLQRSRAALVPLRHQPAKFDVKVIYLPRDTSAPTARILCLAGLGASSWFAWGFLRKSSLRSRYQGFSESLVGLGELRPIGEASGYLVVPGKVSPFSPGGDHVSNVDHGKLAADDVSSREGQQSAGEREFAAEDFMSYDGRGQIPCTRELSEIRVFPETNSTGANQPKGVHETSASDASKSVESSLARAVRFLDEEGCADAVEIARADMLQPCAIERAAACISDPKWRGDLKKIAEIEVARATLTPLGLETSANAQGQRNQIANLSHELATITTESLREKVGQLAPALCFAGLADQQRLSSMAPSSEYVRAEHSQRRVAACLVEFRLDVLSWNVERRKHAKDQAAVAGRMYRHELRKSIGQEGRKIRDRLDVVATAGIDAVARVEELGLARRLDSLQSSVSFCARRSVSPLVVAALTTASKEIGSASRRDFAGCVTKFSRAVSASGDLFSVRIAETTAMSMARLSDGPRESPGSLDALAESYIEQFCRPVLATTLSPGSGHCAASVARMLAAVLTINGDAAAANPAPATPATLVSADHCLSVLCNAYKLIISSYACDDKPAEGLTAAVILLESELPRSANAISQDWLLRSRKIALLGQMQRIILARARCLHAWNQSSLASSVID